MFNVRLAGGHLYWKQLIWLSLVVSLMASFVLSFFPLDVLDEILDLIESVSEGFLTYSCLLPGYSGFIWGFILVRYFSGVDSHPTDLQVFCRVLISDSS